MRQTTWTPVYFIAQLFYFIALVRTALSTALQQRSAIKCQKYNRRQTVHAMARHAIYTTAKLADE